MSDTAARLRALVEALPEYARADPIIRTAPAAWTAAGGLIIVRGSSIVVASAEAPEVEALIADLDPPVVLALADLLDALEVVGPASEQYSRSVARLCHARDALDAALNREPQT